MNRFLMIINKILHIIFENILHLQVKDSTYTSLMQFIKFGIVGVSNTVISYMIYVISLLLFQDFALFPRTDYLIAQVMAFILSVLWSFYWNNKYVFKKGEGENRSIFRALMKTYVSYAFTGLFLSAVLSLLWVQVFHIPKIVAPIANLLISVPINFLINKFWAFKSGRGEK